MSGNLEIIQEIIVGDLDGDSARRIAITRVEAETPGDLANRAIGYLCIAVYRGTGGWLGGAVKEEFRGNEGDALQGFDTEHPGNIVVVPRRNISMGEVLSTIGMSVIEDTAREKPRPIDDLPLQ